MQSKPTSLPVSTINALLEQTANRLTRKQAASQQEAASVPTLTAFKQTHWRGYHPAPHQAAMDEVLSSTARYIISDGAEGNGRAYIAMPPRHGKSWSLRFYAAWLLAQRPDINLMIVAHSARLAIDHSRAVRGIITRPEYQARYPHVKLAGSRTQNRWETSAGGGLLAAGIQTSVAGFPAQALLCDDLIGSRADAESATIRHRLEETWDSDLLTRLDTNAAIVICGTRWRVSDIYEYATQDEDDWQVLRLPALAETEDPLGRVEGEALWTKYPADWLQKQKERMGVYAFASLYQNAPQPRGESLYDTSKIQIIDIPPRTKTQVRAYDLAVSGKTRADYSVGVLLGNTEDAKYVILHVDRWQSDPVTTFERIIQNAQQDGKDTRIILETDNHARAQLDFLLRDPRLATYTIETRQPTGDKFTRSLAAAARVNNGQVSMMRANWNRAFLDELSAFPMGGTDDQNDAFVIAYNTLAEAAVSNMPTVWRQARVKGRDDRGIPSDRSAQWLSLIHI